MAPATGVFVAALPLRGAFTSSHELLNAGRAMADALKEPLTAVLLGGHLSDQASELMERGADRVVIVECEALAKPNEELQAAALAQVFGGGAAKVLFPSTVNGRSLAARVSVLMKTGIATDVFEFAVEAGALKVKRAGYGGNIISEVTFSSQSCVMTLQAMVWPPAPRTAGKTGATDRVPFTPGATRTEFVAFEGGDSGEVDLASADIVVSGGRGVGGPDGFKVIRDLAKALGAAAGASRAAVDSGWIPYRYQVGLTGRTIRPKMYVACGISGQIQHLAGMSSAKTIVAVNPDPECPMMKAATLAVVGDLHELLPLIAAEVRKRKGA
ncbi:MAG: electron transfer flavoprotein subunit alpha/FixB family protein [Elusimicrobia bacterium]|nr:electron transfer flavoprotein subunit alpha/FixB family protein [Elusimicrobiota bacterium]